MTEAIYFVSGGVGGICAVLVGHPLDTVKVRLQTMPATTPPMYTGTLDCFQKTIRNEGVRGLYKGMSAPLLAIAPIFAISFMGYGIGKRIFNKMDLSSKYLTHLGAGGFAGIFTTIIMAPGERIKSLLQVQQSGPKIYDGPWDCMKKLFKEGGIRSIYTGTVATLLRDIPASGMYFMTYEAIQDYMTNGGEQESTFLGTVLAGGFAGVTHWIAGMPNDVLKSRIQTAPKGTYPNGIRDAFKSLIVNEGPFALYKGFTPVILRAFPANAATFVGFEMTQKLFAMLLEK